MPRRPVLLALAAMLAAPSAHAYLDPTSGSMVLQMIVGGIAGIAVVIKLYWHKLLSFFRPKKGQHDEPGTSS